MYIFIWLLIKFTSWPYFCAMLQTRCPDVLETEQLRRGAEDFIDRSFHTDACLIFAPSQVSPSTVSSLVSTVFIYISVWVNLSHLGISASNTYFETECFRFVYHLDMYCEHFQIANIVTRLIK